MTILITLKKKFLEVDAQKAILLAYKLFKIYYKEADKTNREVKQE